ncbi:MAG: hypothetical protein HYZ19_00395 [Rhodocyclales bacterium]|nr:hypothetical protein [Rhodocyclales bacterium]
MRSILPVLLVALALPVAAETAPEPPAVAESLAVVAELGRINGQALACGHRDVVARAKTVVVAVVPKTRRYGSAYEEATQEAFLAQGRGASPCPEGPALMARLEAAAARLAKSFPPSR